MNILEQLEREEGRVRHACQDHLGFWTIGVGRLIDERKGGGLSDEEISFLLANDVKRCESQLRAALPWYDTLSEPRQAVLINMAFQMGVAGLLSFKQTLAAIRDQHFAHAANLMLDSLWAKQTPARARRMSRQMETGEWQ